MDKINHFLLVERGSLKTIPSDTGANKTVISHADLPQ